MFSYSFLTLENDNVKEKKLTDSTVMCDAASCFYLWKVFYLTVL